MGILNEIIESEWELEWMALYCVDVKTKIYKQKLCV